MAACGAHVVSIERIASLADTAAERLQRLGFDVEVHTGDGSLGVPEQAPFDAIAVGAAAPRLPLALARQLVEGGRLVVPIADSPRGEELTRLRIVNGHWQTEFARTLQVRPADRRRRLPGGRSGAELSRPGSSPARRYRASGGAGTRNMRTRAVTADRSTACLDASPNAEASTMTTSSSPGRRSRSGRDMVTAY